MKTTLKRGMGRGAVFDGDGRAVFPPGVRTPMTRYRQPEPEPRSAWQLIRVVALWTILAALVVAGGAAGAAYLRAHRFVAAVAPKTKQDKATAKRLDVAVPGQPTTALVIGTDKRKGKEAEVTGRSDTLMLVRADPQTDSISLLSFPRDLLVTIKCPGRPSYVDRINAAFTECGSLGSVETVRALTGIPINYFITVNFRGFMQLVDNLGGIWIDVDHRYYCGASNCPGISAIDLQPGYQRLRAFDALAYVRYRHFDTDLYRVARQQLFLKALKQQITASLDLNTVLDIVDAVEKNVVIGRGEAGGAARGPAARAPVRRRRREARACADQSPRERRTRHRRRRADVPRDARACAGRRDAEAATGERRRQPQPDAGRASPRAPAGAVRLGGPARGGADVDA